MSTDPVLRLSVGYDLHVAGLMPSPHVDADISTRPRLAIAAGLCAGLMF